jgi:hypothetical protein
MKARVFRKSFTTHTGIHLCGTTNLSQNLGTEVQLVFLSLRVLAPSATSPNRTILRSDCVAT